jgi:hypothetical protein
MCNWNVSLAYTALEKFRKARVVFRPVALYLRQLLSFNTKHKAEGHHCRLYGVAFTLHAPVTVHLCLQRLTVSTWTSMPASNSCPLTAPLGGRRRTATNTAVLSARLRPTLTLRHPRCPVRIRPLSSVSLLLSKFHSLTSIGSDSSKWSAEDILIIAESDAHLDSIPLYHALQAT